MSRSLCTLFVAACLSLLTAASATDVTLTSSGARLNQNGQTEVPVGVFGAHALRGDLTGKAEEFGIHAYRTINFGPNGSTKIFEREKRKKKKKKKRKNKGDAVAAPTPTPAPPAPLKLHPFNSQMDVFIDCEGDRFSPPLQLLNPTGWQERAEHIARVYGNKWLRIKKETDYPGNGIVQLWNEAYLNWAERSAGDPFDGHASIFHKKRYDISRAEPGGPVHLPGVEKPLNHMVWKNIWPTRTATARNFRNGDTREHMQIGWSIKIPDGLKVGDTFEAAERRYWRQPGVKKTWTVTETMQPWDPTMKGYWSGRQALDFYTEMFDVWSRTLTEVNSDITILGGWDFNYSAGGWLVWTELYRPLLQKFPKRIDGLTEHHYGLSPALIQAWYELGTGEALAITGRWLKNWNTECQGRLDPAVFGRASNAVGNVPDKAEAAFWEAQYNFADMIGLIANTPAKVGSRTMHNFSGPGFWHTGGAWSLKLLKPLRGELIAIDSNDQRLWAAASAPTSVEGVGTTLALYNSSPKDMTVTLPTWDAGEGTVHRVATLDLSGVESVTRETPLLRAVREKAGASVEVPSRTAVIITWPKTIKATGPAVLTRKQFFPKQGGLLRAGGEDGDLALTLVGDLPASAPRRAWVRVVADTIPDGAVCELAGHKIELSRIAPITDFEIPAELVPKLAQNPSLTFSGPNGYRVVMTSVMTEE